MLEQELKDLLADMSLEEKIGQLVQLPAYFQDGGNATGPAAEMGITQDDLRLAGSYLSIVGAEKIRNLQKQYMENHPHHIPLLFMADIINGYRTVFPIPLAQSCTFNPELVEECAQISAEEAAASGIHVTFSPMADLVRDARWGRVMESAGEDPLISGEIAAAMVRGYQGSDAILTEKGRIAACLKHFAGYGAPEGGRDYNNVELSPRTLREDYLPAYRAAIDAGCELVMTSFNTLDRIPSSANYWLLQDVLRKEMEFEGVVISDWDAVGELVAHGIAADETEAAKLAISAGVDIDMASPCYIKHLKELVEAGSVSERLIDEAVLRVLQLKNRLGLFENPYKDLSEEEEKKILLSEKNRCIARECAEKTFVLLRNENQILPFDGTEKIAFIGPYADNRMMSGSWSMFSEDEDCITLKEALQEHPNSDNFTFARGCPVMEPGETVIAFQKTLSEEKMDLEDELRKAVEMAKSADRVVLALGEHREFTGEGASRSKLTLPKCQMRLLEQVAAVNPNIVVVLFCGRPMEIRTVTELAKAVLVAWLPGIEGGNALVRTLFGDSAPAGKLTMAFPYCLGQLPIHYNHLSTGRPFTGDFRTNRYGSKYQDIPNEPLYPFGFGLTYTEFTYSDVQLDKDKMTEDDTIEASICITNTGRRSGTQVLQLYIRDLSGSVARPVLELKDFSRVTLNPGESMIIRFYVTEEMLRFHDINMNYTSEPGDFEVYIGPDSTTQNKARFTLMA